MAVIAADHLSREVMNGQQPAAALTSVSYLLYTFPMEHIYQYPSHDTPQPQSPSRTKARTPANMNQAQQSPSRGEWSSFHRYLSLGRADAWQIISSQDRALQDRDHRLHQVRHAVL